MTLPTALIATLSLACGRGGPPDGHTPGDGGDGGDGGTTIDGGTTDGGTTDGGTVEPTGITGLRGESTVEQVGDDWTYVGSEETYYEAMDGSSWCSIVSQVGAVADETVPPCEDCEWSFTLETSDSQLSAGCSGGNASEYDGLSFSYGYVQADGYGVFAYYYEGYGWYGTYATADWSASTGAFQYDWPQTYLYYTY